MSLSREQLQKHWEVIKAFKDGAEIQFRESSRNWVTLDRPRWIETDQYRVKPKPKTPRTATVYFHRHGENIYHADSGQAKRDRSDYFDTVELTPEVTEALKTAGIEFPDSEEAA